MIPLLQKLRQKTSSETKQVASCMKKKKSYVCWAKIARKSYL